MSNTMTGREVLRALADGVSLEDIEYTFPDRAGVWSPMNVGPWHIHFVLQQQQDVKFRRKGKTRTINGFTVPAPEVKAPSMDSTYYVPDPYTSAWGDDMVWDDQVFDRLCLARGLVFLTKADAIANAKAMCGVDPSKEST